MPSAPVTAATEPTVVLIHGTPLTPAAWQETAAALGPRKIVVPDCTRVPPRDAQASLAAQIARDTEGDLHVVGHSFGGQTAIELALLAPARVRTLTIMCSRDTPFPTFAATADAVADGHPPSAEATLARWFTPAELAGDGRAVALTRDELAGASTDDWAAALRAIAGYDRSARTPGIRVPTTVIGAGLDAVSTPDAVTAMAERIPGAVLHIRDDWAHMSPFAHVDELAALLVTAFGKVE